MFYNSLIVLVLDYGDIIWGDRRNSSHMADLQVLQYKAAQIILDLPPYHSGTDALRQLAWKPLAQYCVIFMYKCVHNMFHINLIIGRVSIFIIIIPDIIRTSVNLNLEQTGGNGQQ
jgi:hypothetical protein